MPKGKFLNLPRVKAYYDICKEHMMQYENWKKTFDIYSDEVLLFGILDKDEFDKSISLYSIEQGKDQIGSVFAIGRTGLVNKIESITTNPKLKKFGIVFNDNAGIKELQFQKKPNKFEILNNYYGN